MEHKIRTLITWVGTKDIAELEPVKDIAGNKYSSTSIFDLIESSEYSFDRAILIHNYKKLGDKPKKEREMRDLILNLTSRAHNRKLEILPNIELLQNPVDLQKIKDLCLKVLRNMKSADEQLYFNVGSGTWAMRWIWFLLSQTSYLNAKVLRGSRELGIQEVDIPYELSGSAIFQRQILSKDESMTATIFDPNLEKRLRSPKLKRLKFKAGRLGLTNHPVFILAGRGCPVDRLANAIHLKSNRSSKTDAVHKIDGFEFSGESNFSDKINMAKNGSLLIDNVEELGRQNQKILLDGYHKKDPDEFPSLFLSSTKSFEEIINSGGLNPNFLNIFTRVTLKIPSLKDRGDDLATLIDFHFKKLCREYGKSLELTDDGLNALIKHTWPGNDAELQNALNQLVLFSEKETLEAYDVAETLFELPNIYNLTEIAEKEIDETFNLKEVLDELSRHYIMRAMNDTGGNKSEAAKLLGVSSQQTLGKWMQRLEI